MGWVFAGALVIIVALAIIVIGRLPRSVWELVGAALLLGVAGYAWQGHPGMVGAPRTVQSTTPPFDEQLAQQRRAIGERYGQAGQWLVMSDGLGRSGNTQDAANVLLSGLRENPRDPNLWVGLGNALVAHGNGVLSPSADYSYRRAMEFAPNESAAPYFYGLALANNGQLDAARTLWAGLAARLPEKSDLRGDIDSKLQMLDRAQMTQPGMTP